MVNYKPGDILIQTRPGTWIGRIVRRVLGGGRNGAIHTEIISTIGLSIVARPFRTLYETSPAPSFEVYRHPRSLIAYNAAIQAERMIGRRYGYWIDICYALDRAFRTTWFSDHWAGGTKSPSCSYLVAESYESAGYRWPYPTEVMDPRRIHEVVKNEWQKVG